METNAEKFSNDIIKAIKKHYDMGELFGDEKIRKWVVETFDPSDAHPELYRRYMDLLNAVEEAAEFYEEGEDKKAKEVIMKIYESDNNQPTMF